MSKHEPSSLKPLKITSESFQIFLKIHGDLCKSKYTTSVNYTGNKFAISIKDTSSKFATSTAGVIDTSGKFAAGVVDIRGKLWEQY
jgi:hypothetical protein